MRATIRLFLILASTALVSAPVAADVHVTIVDRRVTIVAKDATLAEIIAEWAKVGSVRVVNADRLPKDRVTLVLKEVSEREALDVLLRNTSGYLAAPRQVAAANASVFDRLAIMPPSTPPAVPPPNPRTAARSQGFVDAPVAPPSRVVEAPPVEVTDQTADPADDEPVPDDAPPAFTSVPVPQDSADALATFGQRHALEVVDPRTFKLPASAMRGTVAPASPSPGAVGAPTPGMVLQPAPPTPPRTSVPPPNR